LIRFLLPYIILSSCSVSEYCEKYAKPRADTEEMSSDDEMSEDEYASDGDDEDDVAIAGKLDP